MTTNIIQEFRRAPAATALMLITVALATALTTIGVAACFQVVQSSGTLFTQAVTPHLLQMHEGPIDRNQISDFAAQHPEIVAVETKEIIGIDGAQLELTPGSTEGSSSIEYLAATQSGSFDHLLTTNGTIAQLEPGTVGIPIDIALNRNITTGDRVTIAGREFTVTQLIRDSIMASDLASSRRILLNDADFRTLRGDGSNSQWLIMFRLTDPALAGTIIDAYTASHLPANGPIIDYQAFRLLNALVDGTQVTIILVFALLLALISALVESLTIRTAIAAELPRIGVLRAIGLPAKRLRCIVLGRQLQLLTLGTIVGTLIAAALIPMVTATIRLRLGGQLSPGLWVLVAATMIPAILGGVIVARAALRPALKAQPLHLIRGTLHQPRSTSFSRTHRSQTHQPRFGRIPSPAWLRLSLNQLRRNPLDHMVLAGIVLLAVVLAALPISLRATLQSPQFIQTTGIAVSDIYMNLRTNNSQAGGDPNRVEDLIKTIDADPDVAKHTMLAAERIPAQGANGEWVGINVESGDHEAFPLTYLSGTAPHGPREIALSELNRSELGKNIGDTLQLRTNQGVQELTVVGIFRDISNGGHTAKAHLPTGAGTPLWTTILLNVQPGVQPSDVVNRYVPLAAPARVADVAAARTDIFGGIIHAMGILSGIASVLALALVAALGALILQLFLVRGTSRRALCQALGSPLRFLRAEYGLRIMLPTILGAFLGGQLAIIFGKGLMGLAGRALNVGPLPLFDNPLMTQIVVPLLLIIVAAGIVACGVRRLPPATVARVIAGQDI